MTFEHLPEHIRTVPLPDLVIADVLDLFVGPYDRRAGAVLFLLCDESDRLVVPVMIDGMPAWAPESDRRLCIRTVTEASVGTGGSVLIALARPDRAEPTRADQAWLADAIRECRDRTRLLGVWACSLHESRRVGGSDG